MDSPEYHIVTLLGSKGRLYYHKGNFYYPIAIANCDRATLEKSIREFTKANRKMIETDRKHPGFRWPWELVDLSPFQIEETHETLPTPSQ